MPAGGIMPPECPPREPCRRGFRRRVATGHDSSGGRDPARCRGRREFADRHPGGRGSPHSLRARLPHNPPGLRPAWPPRSPGRPRWFHRSRPKVIRSPLPDAGVVFESSPIADPGRAAGTPRSVRRGLAPHVGPGCGLGLYHLTGQMTLAASRQPKTMPAASSIRRIHRARADRTATRASPLCGWRPESRLRTTGR